MRAGALGAVLLLSAACAPPPPGSAAPDPSGTCWTGTVATRGAEPFVQPVLALGDGSGLALEGDHADRIRTLQGATVTVCGLSDGSALTRITAWELRAVDGMQAYLGVLRRTGGGFALDPGEGRPPVPLSQVGDALASRAGRTLWVAGTWAGPAFAVTSFGDGTPPADR